MAGLSMTYPVEEPVVTWPEDPVLPTDEPVVISPADPALPTSNPVEMTPLALVTARGTGAPTATAINWRASQVSTTGRNLFLLARFGLFLGFEKWASMMGSLFLRDEAR